MKKSLASFFIPRPVLTWVIHISTVLVGLFLLKNVNLRENPKVESPTIQISMEYPGADTQVVESQIANLMEEELAGIEDLKSMETSISKSGETRINLHFGNSRSVDTISNEIEGKMRRIKNSFPQGLKDPLIQKSRSDDRSFITLAIIGDKDKHSASELSDMGYRYAKSEFEAISGVASVKISGISGEGRAFRIDVWLDPDKLFSFGLTAMDVFNSIGKQSYVHPAGHIEINNIRYNATISNDLKSEDEFANVVLKDTNGKIIKVKDVANVEMQNTDNDVRTRYNGQVASFIDISVQPQANQINISKKVKDILKSINKSLPEGVKVETVIDNSEPVKQSINRVIQAIFEAIIFVVLVMLLFLRSWKSALIPLITIPICLLSGIIIISIFGFSINVITLLAMVLAVGLVVDDAIVAIEVIDRRIKNGENAKQASIKGMAEIQFSIVAMTITLVAVYAPIGLSGGVVGKLFTEFAVSLSGMVLMSGIVALVLTPVMSSSLLKNDSGLNWKIINKFHVLLNKLEEKYKNNLKIALDYKNHVMVFSLFIGMLGLIVGKFGLQSVIVPDQDKGILSVNMQPASGANVKYMEYSIAKAETILKQHSGVKSAYSSFSSGNGMITLFGILKPFKNRQSCNIVSKQLSSSLNKALPGNNISVKCDSGSFSGDNNSLQMIIRSNKSYDELERFGTKAVEFFRNHKGIDEGIKVSRVTPEKTFTMEANRERALSLGVDLAALRENISIIMRGNPPAVRYERNGKRYPVSVWAEEKFRVDPEGIKRFHVYTNIASETDKNSRKLISLKDIIQVVETSSRPMIMHQDGVRAFSIYGKLKPGHDALSVYQDLENKVYETLPAGYSIVPGLEIKKLKEEGNNFTVILILSLIFIFLIMSAQFESFYDPLIIMISVPLALAGAIFTIFIIPGLSLNIYSQIGLVTLIGLITKHAVLILDYYKKSKKEGLNNIDAILKASVLRLRPILMTTLAMVLGAVPLILAGGFGSEFRKEIGWVIVGGMSFGTLFTLFVVPAACIVLSDLRFKLTKDRIAKESGEL